MSIGERRVRGKWSLSSAGYWADVTIPATRPWPHRTVKANQEHREEEERCQETRRLSRRLSYERVEGLTQCP